MARTEITVRATAPVVEIIERIIRANDKPRAEVIIDIQILEVSRLRTKELGLDLGNYALSAVFSPEADPRGSGDSAGTAASPSRIRPAQRPKPLDFCLRRATRPPACTLP